MPESPRHLDELNECSEVVVGNVVDLRKSPADTASWSGRER
jgi:hypothetical protein